MIAALLTKGMLVGFLMGMPVGPAGFYSLRWALKERRFLGISAGLGVATADALFAILAGSGVTYLSSFWKSHRALFQVGGGIFLCGVGLQIFFSQPPEPASNGDGSSWLAYVSGFFLTITNPVSMLSYAALWLVLGIESMGGQLVGALTFGCGVFMGSSLLWIALNMGVIHWTVKHHRLPWVDRIAGAVIVLFGLASLALIKK